MCGRVVAARTRDLLVAELGIDDVVGPDLGLRWNVAPTDLLYAVAGSVPERNAGSVPERNAGSVPERSAGRSEEGHVRRRLGTMTWGLLPSWAKDPASGPRPINARVESLLDRPHFAGALANRRCLVPVDGFYEWGNPGGAAGGVRRPHFLAPADGSVLAIAGVWDRWCGPDAEPLGPSGPLSGATGPSGPLSGATGPSGPLSGALVSCAVITTEANDDVASLHDRMPACLDRGDWDEWLDPANRDEAALFDLLRLQAPGRLVVRPVSRLVNSTANDGPQLLADPEPEPPTLFPA